jgi:hypothetical protein
MKATHNIKINGCWYSAGEELPEEKKPAKAPEMKQEEVPAEETKPKAASRRKKISE